MATAALVLGILGFIPLVTSAAALVLGALALRRCRATGASGRGRAITGVVLGAVGLVGWVVGGAVFLQASRRVAAVAEAFTRDLTRNDIDAAAQRCVAGMSRSDLSAVAATMQPWGELEEMSFSSFGSAADGSGVTWHLEGSATFAAHAKVATDFRLTKHDDGGYRVLGFRFR